MYTVGCSDIIMEKRSYSVRRFERISEFCIWSPPWPRYTNILLRFLEKCSVRVFYIHICPHTPERPCNISANFIHVNLLRFAERSKFIPRELVTVRRRRPHGCPSFNSYFFFNSYTLSQSCLRHCKEMTSQS